MNDIDQLSSDFANIYSCIIYFKDGRQIIIRDKNEMGCNVSVLSEEPKKSEDPKKPADSTTNATSTPMKKTGTNNGNVLALGLGVLALAGAAFAVSKKVTA